MARYDVSEIDPSKAQDKAGPSLVEERLHTLDLDISQISSRIVELEQRLDLVLTPKEEFSDRDEFDGAKTVAPASQLTHSLDDFSRRLLGLRGVVEFIIERLEV
jgi:hypothetical protein